MRLYSYLYKNRFGIYYLRIQRNGVDRRISLRTRDPALARQYSYQFSASMSPMKNNDRIAVWGLRIKGDTIEATDIKSKEDHEQVEAIVQQHYAHQLKMAELLKSSASTAVDAFVDEAYFSQRKLDEAIDEYILTTRLNNQDGKIPDKSINMMSSTLRDLSKRAGDIFIHQLTDEVVLNKWREPRRLEVKDTTVKRDLTWIIGFSKWCAEKGRNYLPKPLEVSIQVKKRDKDHYEYFTKADMCLMLEYIKTVNKPWHFWLILMGIYTGARIGEIAGIRIKDFEKIWGIDTVFIEGTKTEASKRLIPIHPDLIEIGLLDYVERRKAKSQEMLFPVSNTKHNGWGGTASKYFSALKVNEFKFSEHKVFHSFRATIVAVLKQARVDIELRCQYVGHDDGNTTHLDIYSREKLRLETVHSILKHIDYSKYYENFSIDTERLKLKAQELLKKV